MTYSKKTLRFEEDWDLAEATGWELDQAFVSALRQCGWSAEHFRALAIWNPR